MENIQSGFYKIYLLTTRQWILRYAVVVFFFFLSYPAFSDTIENWQIYKNWILYKAGNINNLYSRYNKSIVIDGHSENDTLEIQYHCSSVGINKKIVFSDVEGQLVYSVDMSRDSSRETIFIPVRNLLGSKRIKSNTILFILYADNDPQSKSIRLGKILVNDINLFSMGSITVRMIFLILFAGVIGFFLREAFVKQKKLHQTSVLRKLKSRKLLR